MPTTNTPLRHIRAILALPFVVTIIVPSILLYTNGLDTFDLWRSIPATRFLMPIAGGLLTAAGLALMVVTIGLFARLGRGTLAPWDPTVHLVVVGPFRHVRNPMISGVMSILLGESIASGSLPLLMWFLFFVLINATFIPLLEEPDLVKRYGEPYRTYRRNVPRWIPRLTPWTAEST